MAFNNRGPAYSDKGDIDHAIADFNEAIRLDPKYARAFKTEAAPTTTRATTTTPSPTSPRRSGSTPNPPSPSYNRGIAYSDKGDTTTPSPTTVRRSGSTPSSVKAFNNRGYAYLEKGDNDRAIADYTEAIRLDPKDADAFNSRGVAFQRQGDSTAHRRLQRGDPARPKIRHAFLGRGFALATSVTSTAPSPTLPRRSGSIRNPPWPALSAGAPICLLARSTRRWPI